MIVEAGHFALILAFVVAAVQGTLPLLGAARANAAWMGLARPAAQAQLLLIALAFMSLTYAYVVSDFSVATVAGNSHTTKPLLYKLTGVWANHEGSMLLWVLILALYGAAVASFGTNLPPALRARVLAVQGLVGTGFLAFILFTSNPFLRLAAPPADGKGLNPLLQDPGLAFHPPFLYLGYVGFSVAFAFAIAALIEGRVDAAWGRWVRPWTLAAWGFLTLGIGLGSWWAYYELGWGGWWFWDPVENASFMPWLVGTALLHSSVVVEKREALKSWTVLLAIIAFGLSLIGTFLVRSGVLTSVHAFATDPERGLFILALLVVAIGGSLILYAVRAPALGATGRFRPVSREGALVLNNLLLATAAAAVFLGTLYPLVLDTLGGPKVSVGAPYFDTIFVPLMAPLVAAMAVAPLLGWKRGDLAAALRRLRPAAAAAAAAAAASLALGQGKMLAALGMALAAWVVMGTVLDLAGRVKLFRAPARESLGRALGLPRAAYGTALAHLGLGVLVAGITASSAWQTERILLMRAGERVELAGYTFTFEGVRELRKDNYLAQRATFTVTRNGAPFVRLEPEKRFYPVEGTETTEAAIRTTWLADLYAVIGKPDGKGAYSVRLYHNPLVPWIWVGGLIMFAAAGLSLSDRRHRVGAPPARPAPAGARGGLVQMLSLRGRLVYLLPAVLFLGLAAVIAYFMASGKDPRVIPSALIDKPAPEFSLPPLPGRTNGLARADLEGRVSVVNVFASWCVPCRAEHPQIARLAEDEQIAVHGLNYKDEPEKALAWLERMGDPYARIGADRDGRVAIDWGVYGVPETFIIDRKGRIRHKHVGPIMPDDLERLRRVIEALKR